MISRLADDGVGGGNSPKRVALSGLAVGASLALGAATLFALPAVADPSPNADSGPTLEVEVEGTLLVVVSDPVGPADAGGASPGEPGADQDELVLLSTDEGLLLPLEGMEADVVTGDQFAGTVLVPEEFFEGEGDPATEVPQSGTEDGLGAASAGPVDTSDVAAAALEEVSDSGVGVAVGDVEIISGGLADGASEYRSVSPGIYGRQQHNVDVVILNVAGKASVSPSESLAALKRGTDFWAANAGEIITWGQAPSPKSITVNQTTACNYASAWRQALKTVGKPASAYQNTGRHLAVYAPVDCMREAGASGYGVIGQGGPHFGGMIWLAGDNGPITAHELGHNLSLLHADAVVCADDVSDVPRNQADWYQGGLRCTNREYEDQFDVMGTAYTLGSDWGTCGTYELCWWGKGPLPALSIAHRDRLGIGEGQISRVSAEKGATQTLTVDGMGSGGATKGLVIVDPVSGERLYVEFRDGGGSEAGTLYSNGFGDSIHPGVKISREKSLGGSPYAGTVALPRNVLGSSLYYFREGDVFTSLTNVGGSPAITVKVVETTWGENAKAKLQVSFGAPSNATTKRLGGANRYSTSVAISKDTFPNTTGGTVFVATGTTFPDALAAAPAAAVLDAPLLLVPSSGMLPGVVAEELARLAPENVIVVGGVGAVSEQMSAQLFSATGSQPVMTRLGGSNRYVTAANIVNRVFPAGSNDDLFNWQTVFIATGRDYPDALSASAAAGSLGAPVLLTDGTSGTLDPNAKAILERMDPETVYIVGGSGAVSVGIQNQIRVLGYQVQRLEGKDRYSTSSEVARQIFAMDQTYPAVSNHYWATGANFPDALSGAPAAARAAGPLYVIPPGCVPAAVLSHLKAKDTQVVNLLGGEGVLSADVARMRTC